MSSVRISVLTWGWGQGLIHPFGGCPVTKLSPSHTAILHSTLRQEHRQAGDCLEGAGLWWAKGPCWALGLGSSSDLTGDLSLFPTAALAGAELPWVSISSPLKMDLVTPSHCDLGAPLARTTWVFSEEPGNQGDEHRQALQPDTCSAFYPLCDLTQVT